MATEKNAKQLYRMAMYGGTKLTPEEIGIIANDPKYAYLYAKNIIQGRFIEGEDAIYSNEQTALMYDDMLETGRSRERFQKLEDTSIDFLAKISPEEFYGEKFNKLYSKVVAEDSDAITDDIEGNTASPYDNDYEILPMADDGVYKVIYGLIQKINDSLEDQDFNNSTKDDNEEFKEMKDDNEEFKEMQDLCRETILNSKLSDLQKEPVLKSIQHATSLSQLMFNLRKRIRTA